MKAIVRSGYGSPEALELRDVDIPMVGDRDVLVRVRASSLNMGDVDYMRGRPLFARMGFLESGQARGKIVITI